MNSKTILVIAAAGAVLSLCAGVPAPQVSGVSMSQNAKGEAIIDYNLSDASAVITLDIQTNATGGAWASIGGNAVSGAQGDVWKVVPTGSHRIKWDATTCWADRQIPASGIRAVVTAWALDNTPDYMAVDISSAAQPNTQTYYPSADFVPGGVTNELYKKSMLLMRKIMAKNVTWTMGSTTRETLRQTNEGTHQVTLTNNYYIGVYEVTQSQWSEVATNSAFTTFFTEERFMRPKEQLCYNEIRNTHSTSASATTVSAGTIAAEPSADSFLGLLRLKTGIDFDLPSEAQWEFAARAGKGSGYWYDGSQILNNNPDANLSLLGRYQLNGGKVYRDGQWKDPAVTCGVTNGTAIVGSYVPNAWGLYDTAGNVAELCLDWYQDDIATAKDASGNYYGGRVNIDPTNAGNYLSGTSASGGGRVARGGNWAVSSGNCRPAYRKNSDPQQRAYNTGFRLSCSAGLR